LVAAFRLSQEPGLDITLLEAREGIGGKINTVTLEGARVELGPDSFLPRDDRPLRLCRDIGLAGELVEPHDFGGWLFRAGELRALPSGTVLGFPASFRSLATARVLSPSARLRAAGELLNPRPLSGPDVSVGAFARTRLGPQVLERLIDPLLAGTRAGDVDEMSLAAAIPPVDAAARSHRSLIRGLAGARKASGGVRPRFFAPREGMHRLVEALEDAMPEVDVRRGTSVDAIERDGEAFAVRTPNEVIEADAAIVTAPSQAAAAMLRTLSRGAAAELERIEHVSSAVVNLLFPKDSVRLPARGSGVLIPGSERMTISGCTWFSNKWPHLAAEDDRITIRCFVGRGARDAALELGDRDLAGVVTDELNMVTTLGAAPSATKVTRWEAGLPRYVVGHLDRVRRIEKELAAIPRLRVAGASLRGSGIPDCIAQAESATAAILRALRG
jgi:oxygen-dependent protoporphyrinogen oxidase